MRGESFKGGSFGGAQRSNAQGVQMQGHGSFAAVKPKRASAQKRKATAGRSARTKRF
jgi:hypothetical protein